MVVVGLRSVLLCWSKISAIKSWLQRRSRGVNSCDTLADATGHVLISTGNRKARPAIQLMPQLWQGLRGNVVG